MYAPAPRCFLLLLLALSSTCSAPPPAASLPLYEEVAYDALLQRPSVYLTGRRALVIRGAALGWDAATLLTPARLVNVTAAFGEENIADWYPESMSRAGVYPFLTPIRDGLESLARAGRAGRAAYLQWRLPLNQTEALHRLMHPLPAFMRSFSPDGWMSACLPARAQRNNFIRVMAWNMLVLGSPGGGMFLHPDNYDSGTWQAQLVGSKVWTLCDPARLGAGESLGSPGGYDTFAFDFEAAGGDGVPAAFPRRACARVTAEAGDILVYPSRWWHQTRVPEQAALPPSHPNARLSIGLAGRWVNRNNYAELAAAFDAVCKSGRDDISLAYRGATPNPTPEVCALVQTSCLPTWERIFSAAPPRAEPSRAA